VSGVAVAMDSALVSSRMISGVPIFSGAPADCVAAIDDDVARRAVRLGFVNSFTAYLLAKNDAYRALVRHFVLLNDGIGLDIVSLIRYGSRFRCNLNGTDFTPFYLKTTRHKYRVYLLGGRPGIAEKAAAALQGIAPQHDYVGVHDGYFSETGNAEVVADIKAKRASLVIVALGNPQQEMWIADNMEKVGAQLTIGVGALFDFLADAVPRAPLWMRRLRLEWLYRLLMEPRRLWKRYMVFTPLLIAHALAERVRVP
jgi:alpha-1,3-mannosyltransferase